MDGGMWLVTGIVLIAYGVAVYDYVANLKRKK